MKYEKAVRALIDEKLNDEEKTEAATKALAGHSMKFTYPDRAETLAEAGILAGLDVDKAAKLMQGAEEGGEEFDQALLCVEIF